MKNLFKKIIGLTFGFLLTLSVASPAHAIFSPSLGEEVQAIKQNVRNVQAQIGTGSLQDAFTVWRAKDGECRDLQDAQIAAGNTSPVTCGFNGELSRYSSSVKNTIAKELVLGGGAQFLDTFGLIINTLPSRGEIISSCLRDDIWELEDLQNVVLQELFRAAVLGDAPGANQLHDDYIRLGDLIKILKDDYKDLDPDDGVIFFPGDRNYYLLKTSDGEGAYEWDEEQQRIIFIRDSGCPYGEFQEAITAFIGHMNNFMVAANPTETASLGNLKEIAAIARIRAAQRAQQFILTNQISLTLGGPEGGNNSSLIKNEAVGGLRNQFGGVLNQVIHSIDEGLERERAERPNPRDAKEALNRVRQDIAARETAIERATNVLTFHHQLSNVSENSLKAMDRTLFEMNETLKWGFDGNAGTPAIIAACETITHVGSQQCTNNFGNPPSCK